MPVGFLSSFHKTCRSYHGLGFPANGVNGAFMLGHMNGNAGKQNMSSSSFSDVPSFGISSDHLGSHFSQNHPPPDPFEDSELPKGTFHLDDYKKKHLFVSPTSSGNSKPSSSEKFPNTLFPDLKSDIGEK